MDRRGPNPLADLDRGVQIRGGSKSAVTPVQCSNQLSYEVTQWRAGQFVGLMFSHERNVYERNVICSAVFEIK